jgi:RimJ/RimL family protein N-acetyltransferase
VEMWSDPVVTRFLGGKPSSPQQSWARLLGYVGHWCVLHFGYWAIEEKATNSFIGEIGFADFKREIVPSLRNLPELGFALIPRAHDKGFATEAARAVVAWGDDRFAWTRTFCLINPENVASQRVVAKLAYEIFERGTFNERPTLFLARSGPPKPVRARANGDGLG